MPTNRPITTDFDSWMRDQERRLTSVERRARHSTRQFAPGEEPPPLGTPYAKRFLSANVNVTSLTPIPWDTTVAADSGMVWSVGNKWFTVPKQGLYMVTSRAGFLTLAGQFPGMHVVVNGGIRSTSYKKPDEQWNEITDIIRCLAGDQVAIWASKTGGGTVNLEGVADMRSWVSLALMGETV